MAEEKIGKVLSGGEVFNIFTATEVMRAQTRNIEFAQKTLDDVRSEAITAISAGEFGPADTLKPLGTLDRLENINNFIEKILDTIDARPSVAVEFREGVLVIAETVSVTVGTS